MQYIRKNEVARSFIIVTYSFTTAFHMLKIRNSVRSKAFRVLGLSFISPSYSLHFLTHLKYTVRNKCTTFQYSQENPPS